MEEYRSSMIPRRRAGLVARELDGEAVVLDRVAGKVHQLNVTAAYVWQRCNGASSIQEMAAALAEDFGIDAGMAAQDVASIIETFGNLGLLVAGDSGEQPIA